MNLKALKKIKKTNLVILLSLGIFLIVLSGSFTSKPKTEVADQQEKSESKETRDISHELEEIIESIEGVSDVKVFISYENSGVKNIAQSGEESITIEDNQKKTLSKKSPITTKVGSDEKPFVAEEILPEVRGVIITAKGLKNGTLRAEITEAVSVALGVPLHKVKIIG